MKHTILWADYLKQVWSGNQASLLSETNLRPVLYKKFTSYKRSQLACWDELAEKNLEFKWKQAATKMSFEIKVFQKTLTKSCKSIFYTSTVNCCCVYILKDSTTGSLFKTNISRKFMLTKISVVTCK